MDEINSVVWIWVITCVLFLALEAFAVAGIGFLYGGLAALTVGFLVAFEVINAYEMMQQIAAFLFISGLWAAVLWIPMKKMLRKKGGGYLNFVGQYAVIIDKPLTPESSGTVKWSGTSMRARIDLAHETKTLFNIGADVVITRVEGNVLYVVSPTSYATITAQPRTS